MVMEIHQPQHQTVVVDDVTAPHYHLITNATGECSATATAPTATDNCAGPVLGTTNDPLTYYTRHIYYITGRLLMVMEIHQLHSKQWL